MQQVNRNNIGRFVQTQKFGMGRLIDATAQGALVRYFRAPGRSPYVDYLHSFGEVSLATPAVHARAYVYDGNRWETGRIEGTHPADADKFIIAFPNNKGVILGQASFDLRWSRPITDPFDILLGAGGDSPLVYEARLGILSEWSRQHAMSLGVQGLVLNPVELHRHQLAVVRRVAADSVQRYLIADEVGLGKTIEAGALVSQYIASHPKSQVLILVPDHLQQQWSTELFKRFRIDRRFDHRLHICSYTDSTSWPNVHTDFLVIDEAHHITSTGPLPASDRARIVELAHSANALLLLSATPVRSNEAGFLDLLYLLDPTHYHPTQLAEFKRRVELRDQFALIYQTLTHDIDEFDMSLYIEQLSKLLPDDSTLIDLLTVATAANDDSRPSVVMRIREHLSETYRLHHRLLRTRRSAETGARFAVRGRTRSRPFTLEVDDSTDQLRSQLLDSLRDKLAAAIEEGYIDHIDGTSILRDVASRCGSLPGALSVLVGPRDQAPEHWRAMLDYVDVDVIDQWRRLIDDIGGSAKVTLGDLGRVLSDATISRGVSRAVVFSAFTESAQAVATELVTRWGTGRIASHLSTNCEDENVAEVARWVADGPCSVLVCDASAEEGINLQHADVLIHIDLPWESFRVEQRIGRCDRHASTRLGPVPSAVVIYGNQPYSSAWFGFLADGCNVFSRSVSSLQYVLSDTEEALHLAVIHGGARALEGAIEHQASLLASEQTRIVAQDTLDSDNPTGSSDIDTFLIESDDNSTLTDALTVWFKSVGTKLRYIAPGVVQLQRRPRPQVAPELEIVIDQYTEQPLALERSSAVQGGWQILRAGHALVDAIAEYLKQTDHGVAFAFMRPLPGQYPPKVIIRTDYLVSFCADNTLYTVADHLNLGAWLRQLLRELAPTMVESVYMACDGTEDINPAFRRAYDKQQGDRNLISRPDLFTRLTNDVDWSGMCVTGMEYSRRILGIRQSIVTQAHRGAKLLRGQVERHISSERAREIAGLPSMYSEWQGLADSLPNELETQFTVLGCGAVFAVDPEMLG